jgi:hypothetical protein
MTGSPGRAGSGPALLLAEVQPGRQAALNQALNEMFAAAPEKPAWRVTDRLLVAADSPASLAALTSTLGQGANSPFAQEIAAHYQRGVRFLFAMDRAAFGMETGGAAASTLGMGGLRYLFFEQRSAGGSDENEASIAFDGPRTGVASWLAAPGPLGSAEYISRDALLAVSVATKNPQQALSELTAAMGRLGPEFGRELAKFEAESGVNLGSDIAAALGTDFALSIDRLSIPTPAWTLAMEVMQPALLDTTIRRLVDRINGLPQTSQAGRRVVYEQQQVNGRDWYTLRTEPPTTAVHWTYDRGYLVAAADRALAMQALATRSGGFPLVRSAEFRAQLPASSGLHQSGFFWLNTKGALAGFAEVLPEGSLKTLAAGEAPLLVAFDGERERIRAVSRTRLTSLVFDALLSHRGANPMGKPGAHAASH